MCELMAARYENDTRNSHYNRHHHNSSYSTGYRNHRSTSANRKQHHFDNSYKRRNDYRRENSGREHKEEKREKVPDEEKPKLREFGDWSEHVSSSGKKYYYNCKSEESQWAKPTDWAEYEKKQISNDKAYKSQRSNESQGSKSSQPNPQPSCSDSPSSSSGGRRSYRDNRNSRNKRERDWTDDQINRKKVHLENRADSVNEIESHRHNDDRSWSSKRSAPDNDRSLRTASKQVTGRASIPQILLDLADKCGVDLQEQDAVEKLKRMLDKSVKKDSSNTTAAGGRLPESMVASTSADTALVNAHDEDNNMDTSPAQSAKQSNDVVDPSRHVEPIEEERSPSPPPLLSLAHLKFHRPNLASHTAGWAAEAFESQSYVNNDNVFDVFLRVSDVSADLKCSRSMVRTAEIKSTLLEQKVRFVRHQYKQLSPSSSTPSKQLPLAPS